MNKSGGQVADVRQGYTRMFEEIFSDDLAKRFLPAVLKELSHGEPVSCETIAAEVGTSPEQARSFLQEVGSEWDGEDKLVGFGITVNPTPHRLEMNGKELYTWCAGDTLLFPVILDVPARAQSPCFATGHPITISLQNARIDLLEPEEAVIALVTPKLDKLSMIRNLICNPQNLFRSAEAAAGWSAENSAAAILPVRDAFEVLKEVAISFFDLGRREVSMTGVEKNRTSGGD